MCYPQVFHRRGKSLLFVGDVIFQASPFLLARKKVRRLGRKGLYHDWLQGDNLLRLEGWARDGLTDAQIAENMGINVSTLYDWKNKYTEFADVLKRTKDVVDREVENALYKAACEGNITAQIFWLKNRKPYFWRDKRETEIAGNGKLELTWEDSRKEEK